MMRPGTDGIFEFRMWSPATVPPPVLSLTIK